MVLMYCQVYNLSLKKCEIVISWWWHYSPLVYEVWILRRTVIRTPCRTTDTRQSWRQCLRIIWIMYLIRSHPASSDTQTRDPVRSWSPIWENALWLMGSRPRQDEGQNGWKMKRSPRWGSIREWWIKGSMRFRNVLLRCQHGRLSMATCTLSYITVSNSWLCEAQVSRKRWEH